LGGKWAKLVSRRSSSRADQRQLFPRTWREGKFTAKSSGWDEAESSSRTTTRSRSRTAVEPIRSCAFQACLSARAHSATRLRKSSKFWRSCSRANRKAYRRPMFSAGNARVAPSRRSSSIQADGRFPFLAIRRGRLGIAGSSDLREFVLTTTMPSTTSRLRRAVFMAPFAEHEQTRSETAKVEGQEAREKQLQMA